MQRKEIASQIRRGQIEDDAIRVEFSHHGVSFIQRTKVNKLKFATESFPLTVELLSVLRIELFAVSHQISLPLSLSLSPSPLLSLSLSLSRNLATLYYVRIKVGGRYVTCYERKRREREGWRERERERNVKVWSADKSFGVLCRDEGGGPGD